MSQNNSYAVLASTSQAPLASFTDLPTAVAWAFQRFKGQPFVIRELQAHQAAADMVALEGDVAKARILTKAEASEEVMGLFEQRPQLSSAPSAIH